MRKIKVVILAPVELIICILHGGWIGARDGIRNIRDAWHEACAALEPKP